MVLIDIQSIDDIEGEINLIKDNLKKVLKNVSIGLSNIWFFMLICQFLPVKFLHNILDGVGVVSEGVFSNVAGSQEPIYYRGKWKVVNACPFLTTGRVPLVFGITTWNNNLNISMNVDKGLGIKPDEIKCFVERTIDKLLLNT
jgi:hypothetical protein